MPESFRIAVDGLAQVDDQITSFRLDRYFACREIAIGSIRSTIQAPFSTNWYALPAIKEFNIAVLQTTNNPTAFSEIQAATQTTFVPARKHSILQDENWFNIEGDIRTKLAAAYWAILAMRHSVALQPGSFLEQMQQSHIEDTNTWDKRGDRRFSIAAWKRLINKGITPSTHEMILYQLGPIEWFHQTRGKDGDWKFMNLIGGN